MKRTVLARIAELEARLAAAEGRIAMLDARALVPVFPISPMPPYEPYKITWADGDTGSRPWKGPVTISRSDS